MYQAGEGLSIRFSLGQGIANHCSYVAEWCKIRVIEFPTIGIEFVLHKAQCYLRHALNALQKGKKAIQSIICISIGPCCHHIP